MRQRQEVWAAVTLVVTLIWCVSQCTLLLNVVR